ncbi:PstS family phosphate ABC transporter substrate-binding protein [Thermocoleostomius sinensis]|nr:PstS family phosphate ABC transporter substrate-binding protein [Thermocoleostomius sinensis]
MVALSVLALTVGCSAPTSTTQTGSQSPQTETTGTVEQVTIVADGSSTVYPLTDEAVQEYQFENRETAEFSVTFSGTTGGFRKFCAGETDISNASRPINSSEIEACRSAGVNYVELPVAYDALTVAVHPTNTWAESMTVAELKRLWEPAAEGTITNWNQIRPDWPNQPINLYGAGSDSGTFDYFTEAIVGESRASRSDYTASEDDEALVRGLRSDPNGLGYFGYAYYEENQRLLKPVAIDNGNGPVLPSSETVVAGDYQPLARPLFIYVNTDALQNKPELREFVEFYLLNAETFAKAIGYVPLPDEVYTIALDHLQQNKVGTAFGGVAETNLKLEDLLQREKTY